MNTPAQPGESDDSGMSLVEVIVATSLTAVIAAVLGTMFISGLRAQAATRDRDVATGSAHLVTRSIETGIRNASGFQINGDLLRARVTSGTSGWLCQAWALSDAKLLTKSSSSAIAADGVYTGWTTLATGVTGSIGGHPFAKESDRLVVRLQVQVGNATVPVGGGAIPQARGAGSPAACW